MNNAQFFSNEQLAEFKSIVNRGDWSQLVKRQDEIYKYEFTRMFNFAIIFDQADMLKYLVRFYETQYFLSTIIYIGIVETCVKYDRQKLLFYYLAQSNFPQLYYFFGKTHYYYSYMSILVSFEKRNILENTFQDDILFEPKLAYLVLDFIIE
jgi:hypothetical protein